METRRSAFPCPLQQQTPLKAAPDDDRPPLAAIAARPRPPAVAAIAPRLRSGRSLGPGTIIGLAGLRKLGFESRVSSWLARAVGVAKGGRILEFLFLFLFLIVAFGIDSDDGWA